MTQVQSHFQYGLATAQAYRHSSYDANSQLLWTSLATTSSTAAGVTAQEKTQNTYRDNGSIYTAQDPANPKVGSSTRRRVGSRRASPKLWGIPAS